MPSKIGLVIRILIIAVFLCVGGVNLLKASELVSRSLPSEFPKMLFQSLYNGNSYMGVIEASLSPNPSFVVGANITAQITIGLVGASNEAYLIEVMFPDALVIRDIPPYTWQQDWTYLLHDIQINGTEQIQTLSNVTLVYAQEGIYGLNMTITQPSTNTKLNFHFDNAVQIKPLSYLDEEFRSNVTFALSYGILGLTFIMIAPVIVQLADFVEKILEKPQSQKSYVDTTTEDKPKGSKLSKERLHSEKILDKDIELQKIQALESEFQAWFNVAASLWTAGFIALAVLWLTLYYEGRLNFFKDVWSNLILTIVVLIIVFVMLGEYGVARMTKVSNEFWAKIDQLLIKVEKGVPLDSLTELRQQISIKRKSRFSLFKKALARLREQYQKGKT